MITPKEFTRERREMYPEGESPSIPKREIIPNAVLDDPELFELQAAVKTNLKTFSFKIFGRTFVFETYTRKEKHRVDEPVEPCSSSAQAAFICSGGHNQTKDKYDFIINLPDIENNGK